MEKVTWKFPEEVWVETCRQVAVSTPAWYKPSSKSCAGQGAPSVVPALYLDCSRLCKADVCCGLLPCCPTLSSSACMFCGPYLAVSSHRSLVDGMTQPLAHLRKG